MWGFSQIQRSQMLSSWYNAFPGHPEDQLLLDDKDNCTFSHPQMRGVDGERSIGWFKHCGHSLKMSHDRVDVEGEEGCWTLLVRTARCVLWFHNALVSREYNPNLGLFQYRWVPSQGCWPEVGRTLPHFHSSRDVSRPVLWSVCKALIRWEASHQSPAVTISASNSLPIFGLNVPMLFRAHAVPTVLLTWVERGLLWVVETDTIKLGSMVHSYWTLDQLRNNKFIFQYLLLYGQLYREKTDMYV